MSETTTQPVALTAYLAYRDATTMVEWLGRAFGFETTLLAPDDDGGVAHAELRLGDATVIVFSDREGYDRPTRKGESVGGGMYLCLPDAEAIDAIRDRAVAEGAELTWQPGWTQWGNYPMRVLDPEGREWTFGVHRPGQPVTWEE